MSCSRRERPCRVGRGVPAALLAMLCALASAPAAGASPGGAARAVASPGGPAKAVACTRSPGDVTLPVTYGGRSYDVLAHLPPAPRAGRLPLVLNLHGSQSRGSRQLGYSGMRATADREGFVVAVPDGAIPAGDGFSWNVPGVTTGPRDDVGFLGQVIDTLGTRLCADPARVYVTGYSGGGRMASALACRIPERIAAIAPVAGLRAGTPDPADDTRPATASCRPPRPVPVAAFHGEQDHTNPYGGGGSPAWRYSVPAAQRRWAELNGCSLAPRTEPLTPHVRRVTYGGCRGGADVVLHDITDGGHTWPGSPEESAGNGHTNREISANTSMWAFFQRHTRHTPRTPHTAH
ncbi:extracellular catalytic domain type 1 short-chain-length polyhydroxyalkanoate depolymerase [Streptomyces flavofungini]|uniref:extracellular catalytic domain type 1 short-chain-length polyhydroxyalkanoate depolymerase n=1 Tax=Streptomyces flavofungini TaxID=68200 RepID=UPI0034E001B3